METPASIDKRAAHICRALEDAFGVRARTLQAALRKTGRRMPRRLHALAGQIVAAQRLGGHPKLMRRVDTSALQQAESEVLAWLKKVDRADARKGYWLGLAGAMVFNLLLVAGAFVAWMVWAGLI